MPRKMRRRGYFKHYNDAYHGDSLGQMMAEKNYLAGHLFWVLLGRADQLGTAEFTERVSYFTRVMCVKRSTFVRTTRVLQAYCESITIVLQKSYVRISIVNLLEYQNSWGNSGAFSGRKLDVTKTKTKTKTKTPPNPPGEDGPPLRAKQEKSSKGKEFSETQKHNAAQKYNAAQRFENQFSFDGSPGQWQKLAQAFPKATTEAQARSAASHLVASPQDFETVHMAAIGYAEDVRGREPGRIKSVRSFYLDPSWREFAEIGRSLKLGPAARAKALSPDGTW